MPLGIQCENGQDCENLNNNYYEYVIQNLQGQKGKDGNKGEHGPEGEKGAEGVKGVNGKEG